MVLLNNLIFLNGECFITKNVIQPKILISNIDHIKNIQTMTDNILPGNNKICWDYQLNINIRFVPGLVQVLQSVI